MADMKPPSYPGYVSNEPQQFQGYVSNEPQQFQGYVNTGQPPQFQGYVNTGQPAQNIVIMPGSGSCPYCRVGYPREEYSACGICLAIFFFPIGILCCLAMKETRCSHCGRNF